MSTPDYYKYDDGETHFECFDISRYYSGDWAQAIQYVFRWQKKGGVEDLKKALACAKDAHYNGIKCRILTSNHIARKAIARKVIKLDNTHYANASEFWCWLINIRYSQDCIDLLRAMIEKARANSASKSV